MGLGGGVDLPAIRQRIVVDDSALSGLGARLGSIGGTLGKAVAGGAAVAAAGIGAFVASGVKGAISVEKGIGEVVTLFGVTGDEAKALGSKMASGVADLSNEVGIAQDALVGGLYSAISAGIPEDNAFEFMRVASKAAIAGVTDVETAVDGISTTINAFGLEASQAEAVSDSMFAAVQGGKTTFEELSSSLANVAPAAAAAGVSFEEVNASIATLTAGGAGTSEATTQLRAALVGLQKPSKELDEIFQAVGYESAQVALESEGLGFALQTVSDAADGNNGKLQQLLGSSEAVAAAQVIAGTGAEKFAAEMERQEGSAGSAADAFDVMNETTSRAMENLKTQFTNAAIAVGSEVLPKLNEVVRWATERLPGAIETVRGVVEGMIEVFRNVATVVGEVVGFVVDHWETIKTTATIVGAVIAVAFGPHLIATLALAGATAVVNAALMVGAWVSTQVAAIKAAVVHSAQIVKMVASWVLLGVQSLLGAAKVAAAWLISMGPIALVIAAVAGLVYLIVRYWDEIKAAIAAGWEFVKRITTQAWNAVTKFLRDKWTEIKREFTAAVDAVVGFVTRLWTSISSAFTAGVAAVVGFVAGLWSSISGAFTAGISAVIGFVTGFVSRVIGFYVDLATRIIGAVTGAWTTIREAFSGGVSGVLELVGSLPGRLVDLFSNAGRMLYDAGKRIVQGLIDGIKAMVGKVGDAITGVTSKIRNALPFSPAKYGPLSGTGSPDRAGRTIGKMIAGGLEDSTSRVAAAATKVAGAAAANLPGVGPAPTGNVAAGVGAPGRNYTLRIDGATLRPLDEGEILRYLQRLETLSAAVPVVGG